MAATTVGTTATRLGPGTASVYGFGSNQKLVVHNNGAAAIFLGEDTDVTTVNGLPLAAGARIDWTHGQCYAIATAGTVDVRWSVQRY